MSECIGSGCDHPSHQAEEKKIDPPQTVTSDSRPIEVRIEEALKSGNLPMTLGVKFFLDKAFNEFKNNWTSIISDELAKADQNMAVFKKGVLDQINPMINRLDKRFSDLYGVLVNKFLVSQENRVYAVELSNQALADVCIDRLFSITPGVSDKEAFTRIFKEDLSLRIEQTHAEIEAKVRQQAEEEKKKNEESKEEQKNDAADKEPVPTEPEAKV